MFYIRENTVGEVVTKKGLSEDYQVDYKTIQRDIEELRNYIEEDQEMKRILNILNCQCEDNKTFSKIIKNLTIYHQDIIKI